MVEVVHYLKTKAAVLAALYSGVCVQLCQQERGSPGTGIRGIGRSRLVFEDN